MTALSDWLAKLGEDPIFVAFNAHCWFAFAVIFVTAQYVTHTTLYVLAGACMALSACKEFLFDANYEENPPQTAYDNATDFAGYVCGIFLALLAINI